MAAAEKTRLAGYRRFEAYSPFPVEGLSEAIGLKRNAVPLITLIGGLVGGLGGFWLQDLVAGLFFSPNITPRPLNSRPRLLPLPVLMPRVGPALSALVLLLGLHRQPPPPP